MSEDVLEKDTVRGDYRELSRELSKAGPPDLPRRALLEIVRREIVGPYEEEEVVDQAPRWRYVVGQLANTPSRDAMGVSLEGSIDGLEEITDPALRPESVDEQLDSEVDDDTIDSGPDGRSWRAVSSIGISFVCSPGVSLKSTHSFGQYSRLEPDSENESETQSAAASADDTARRSPRREKFKRTPHSYDFLWPSLVGNIRLRQPLGSRGYVELICREHDEFLVATIFTVNATPSAPASPIDERLYQVEMEIVPQNEGQRPFLARHLLRRSAERGDPEAIQFEMLYRNRREYAVGRNTAVDATDISDDLDSAGALRSTAMPVFELPVTVPLRSDGRALDMVFLSDCASPQTACAEMDQLFSDYGAWIRDRTEEADGLPAIFADLATRRVDECQKRLQRLRRGLEILRGDAVVYDAFRVANEAMARVVYRNRLLRPDSPRRSEDFDSSGREGAWFPFQLAFLLSVIPDIALTDHPDVPDYRDFADVLFFPTGGGKTEAYLGVIAFAAALRRARGTGAGVAAILRYTYRILSTQQFARGATLICALESMRRDQIYLAKFPWLATSEPFSVGLWIGSAQTPNSFSAVKGVLRELEDAHTECIKESCPLIAAPAADTRNYRAKRAGFGKKTPSPLVLGKCPWCGAAMCIADVQLNGATQRTSFICPDERCLYSQIGEETFFAERVGLPMVTVDDEVFRTCPTLIVGTADKYATLWNDVSGRALFGLVSAYCPRHGFITAHDDPHRHGGEVPRVVDTLAPIDLFVQDELHLINEALGSAYGMVEFAVDKLAERKGQKPKVIAATATLRRSEEQIRRLFGRESAIFPVAPITAGDSFFASEQACTPERPGRLYVGLYAPLRTSRLYPLVVFISAILQAAYSTADEFGLPAADPYLTLVAYFNTLRDLGQVQGLLVDDVEKTIRTMAKRIGPIHRTGREHLIRPLADVKRELTSKVEESDLMDAIRSISMTFAERLDNHVDVCDVVCTTNMLSVGVDIQRLGAMLVDGQPKTTSEYIQATSRVGRRSPGLVFVAYNAARPRDISHYEHFFSYHQALYKHVEASTVTPYSAGTIDKYLANAFIAAYRLGEGFSAKDEPRPFADHLKSVIDTQSSLIDRAHEVAETTEEDYLHERLDDLIERWSEAAESRLSYTPSFKGKQTSMFVARMSQASERPANVLFDAPMSLRNVEPEVRLRVVPRR